MNNKSNFIGNETPPNYLPQLNFTSKRVKNGTKTNKNKQKTTTRRPKDICNCFWNQLVHFQEAPLYILNKISEYNPCIMPNTWAQSFYISISDGRSF